MKQVDLYDFFNEDTDFLDADKDFGAHQKHRHDIPKAVGDDDQSIREWIFDSEVQAEVPNVASGLRISLLCMSQKMQGKTVYGSAMRPIGSVDELVKKQG
jgi:O-succinylbenzoate synthase